MASWGGPVLSGAFMIFVPALTELTLSSMLAAAGTKTVGLIIFNYQQAGDYSLAAAMSAIVTALVLTGYALANQGRDRWCLWSRGIWEWYSSHLPCGPI